MKALALFATVALLTLSVQDDVQKELAKFQGTWRPTYVEIDGKELKDDDIKDDRLLITGSKFTFTGPKTKMGGTIKIDPSKKPRSLDVETTEGDNKGVKTVGIYEIDAKKMMVCYRLAPSERPTEFSTTANSGRFIIIYQRVK